MSFKETKKFKPHLESHQEFIDRYSKKHIHVKKGDAELFENETYKQQIFEEIKKNRAEAEESREKGEYSQLLKDHWNEASRPHQNIIPRDMHDVIELTQPVKLAGKIWSAANSFFGG